MSQDVFQTLRAEVVAQLRAILPDLPEDDDLANAPIWRTTA